CVEQDDKGWDARKRAYCLKIQPATGSFARNLIYSTKPLAQYSPDGIIHHHRQGLQCWYALYSSPPGGTIHESWWARNHHTQNVRQHAL
ncbi:hypothetical protein, partial [Klebsiella pneumoniae]|uniref:hypothetical protein n=1 Tax=Klebsiella pneumoniae TaxID=573 RepID=UPI001CBC2E57